MTGNPTPINRPLTDDERDLLAQLTIWVIADQTGVTDEAAAEALDDLNQKSGLSMQGDNIDAYVKTTEHRHVILHCTREWLAFHAHSGEQLTSEELRRALKYDKPGDEA